MTIYLPRFQLHQTKKRTADSELLLNSPFQWPLPSFCLFNWSSLWWSIFALRSSASWSVAQSISQSISNSSLPLYTFPHKKKLELQREEVKKINKDERSLWSDSLSAARALLMWKGRRGVVVGRRRSGDALERRASLVRRVIA